MFKIFKANNKKQKDKIIDSLSKQAAIIYEERRQYVLSKLENDIQKEIFLCWWNGECLTPWNNELNKSERAEKFKNVSDHDWRNANGWIMDTISNGMG